MASTRFGWFGGESADGSGMTRYGLVTVLPLRQPADKGGCEPVGLFVVTHSSGDADFQGHPPSHVGPCVSLSIFLLALLSSRSDMSMNWFNWGVHPPSLPDPDVLGQPLDQGRVRPASKLLWDTFAALSSNCILHIPQLKHVTKFLHRNTKRPTEEAWTSGPSGH